MDVEKMKIKQLTEKLEHKEWYIANNTKCVAVNVYVPLRCSGIVSD